MKKTILIAVLVASSFTLFSFKSKVQKVFELQENGNYKVVNGDKISQEDLDFLTKETKTIEGAKIFRTIKIFKTSIGSEVVKEVVTSDTQKDCPCPPEEEVQAAIRVNQLIQKYNN